MIRPFRDEFYSVVRLIAAGVHEVARVPIAPRADAIGSAQLFIAAKGAGSRFLVDEARARFLKTGNILVVRPATRPEAADVGGGVAGATISIAADGTDLVVRVTLSSAVTVRVFVSCELRGAYGDDE